MFALIWTTLLFFVRSNSADAGSSGRLRERCGSGFCITLNEGEITAEAGLCVVIPCSFYAPPVFSPLYMIWFKCDPYKQKCADSDIIFHSNEKSPKVQSGFKGRVSLLEPNIDQRNCSIIISDLTESDSGSYQLRLNGVTYYGKADGFLFPVRTLVSVKELSQKPTVVVPRMTEGQQATLTCTAPGLCSGSNPDIMWTWRGRGEADSPIAGSVTNVTAVETTAGTWRHSSTLTFKSSADLHDTSVTCKVSFTNAIATEETVTLNVTYVKELKITGILSMKEGETLNLTCSLESFPPSVVTLTKSSENNGTETNGISSEQQNKTLPDLQNEAVNSTSEGSGMATFLKPNVTPEDSGQYICTAKYLNDTLMKTVDVNVIYMRSPLITGDTSVEVGDTLNLTCSVESYPQSQITWSKLGSNFDLESEPNTDLQSNRNTATLLIQNVVPEHSGQYVCRVQYLDATVSVSADVAVTLFPKILKSSGCWLQPDILTCTCISEGSPLPTIRWQLLKNHTEYSVVTMVSKQTISSTFTLRVHDDSKAAVECVSSNQIGEAIQNLMTSTGTSTPAAPASRTISWLQVIIAFLTGVLLSAVICCLLTKGRRMKQKSFGNLNETMEMVTTQEDPLIDAGPESPNDHTYYQETAEEEGGSAVEKASLDDGAKDVAYASIDFSLMKRMNPREARKHESTETEYAEIKRKAKGQREDGREEGERSEGKVEEVMGREEEEGNTEVYSNIKDIMGDVRNVKDNV